jgi:DNA-binding MarR family transcriptional regulator/ribosomal protein S18 acetylase RimI-like enzyme
MTVSPTDIEVLRQFNRFYTQTIGVLSDRYLGQARPLGESRLLFEIGGTGGTGADVRELRGRLDLDAGYVSRMLRSLQDQGLVLVRSHPGDNRARVAELTPAGQRELAGLNERAATVARGLLEPLTQSARAEVIQAMETIRRRLRLTAITVGVTDPVSAIARRCLDAFASELERRFPGGFDRRDLIAPAEARGKRGAFVVVREGDEPAGCGVVSTMAPGVAEIRHVWVAPGARRLGLGRRILTELERQACARGLTTVRLDTHEVLSEAIAMYRASGYHEIPRYHDNPYAYHWFEKHLPGPCPPARAGSPAP